MYSNKDGIKMQKTKEIKGKSYQVAPFMAVEGLRLKAYLLKVLGPALGELMNVTGSSGADTEINGEVVGKMIEKVTETLDEDTFIALIKRLMQNVICNWKDEEGNSKAIAFSTDFNTAMNAVFQGELFSIYPVLGFVLEVNYPDFFEKVVPTISQKMGAIDISSKAKKK